jgi:hypothetical protein
MTGGSASGQLDLLQLRGLLACHALPFPKMKLRAQLGGVTGRAILGTI